MMSLTDVGAQSCP